MNFDKFIKGTSNDLEEINKEDYIKSFNFLIEDENEAINGYDKILLLLENSNEPNKEEIIKDLKKIKNDEIEHIEILKNVMKKYFDKEYGSM